MKCRTALCFILVSNCVVVWYLHSVLPRDEASKIIDTMTEEVCRIFGVVERFLTILTGG